MAKTRSTKPVASKQKAEVPSKPRMTASVDTPPHVLILPKDASSDARITSLPNPANAATPSRYFVCPDKGIYEFTRIAAPKASQRSWLLAPDRTLGSNEVESDKDAGYVLTTPDMLVATPIDPLFLLLPSMAEDVNSIGQEYLAPSDYLAKLAASSPGLSQILQSKQPNRLEKSIDYRIAAVCDSMDMGDEQVYALSLPKLVRELVSKAKRMTARGLPASMEERFVKQALEVPVLSIRREESSISLANDKTVAGAESEPASEVQSHESAASLSTTTTVSTAVTSISVADADCGVSTPTGVLDLLRTRVALNFLLSSYLSSTLRKKLDPLISDTKVSSIDFTLLSKHLEHIASLKKEAQALRSLSDNISRKRSAMDDDEDASEKAEAKKRKKEEEENRKKNVSQGVKKLMKADTSGMKKLSSFFTKPPAKK